MLFDDQETDQDFDDPRTVVGVTTAAGLAAPRETVECLGHGEIERQLLGLIDEDKLPHALIFAGPEGIGKATMAFRLARFLLNEKPKDDGPGLFGAALPTLKPDSMYTPQDAPVFRQVATGAHPDLLVIERLMDEKKGKKQDSVSVEEVRRVVPFLRMKAAHDGGWRVVIVDDADTMTNQGQNAILKILEEPPPRTVLVLIAHRPGAMIPTIRSRCRVISFQPPVIDVFRDLVRRNHAGIPDGDIATLYAVARGSVGLGINMLEQGGLESIGKIMALLSAWPRWDWPQIHAQAEIVGRSGSENALQSFNVVLQWIVESIVRNRACGQKPTGILDNEAISGLMNHYSLADWIQICENLKVHFDTADFANLDKRQAVIGAFSILDYKEAA